MYYLLMSTSASLVLIEIYLIKKIKQKNMDNGEYSFSNNSII